MQRDGDVFLFLIFLLKTRISKSYFRNICRISHH